MTSVASALSDLASHANIMDPEKDSSQVTQIHNCANCQAPSTLKCPRCKDTPTQEDTWYCSKSCQTIHWNTHKRPCAQHKTVKAFYRAGKLIQEIWYVYREKTFDKPIMRIEEKNGNLHLVDRKDSPGAIANLRGFQFLERFPSEICRNLEVKQDVLVFLCCGDGLAWMQEVVEYLLKGIVLRCACII